MTEGMGHIPAAVPKLYENKFSINFTNSVHQNQDWWAYKYIYIQVTQIVQ